MGHPRPVRTGLHFELHRSLHRRLGRDRLHDAVTRRLSVIDGTGTEPVHLRQSFSLRSGPCAFRCRSGACLPALQICCGYTGSLGVIACWILARDVSGSIYTATLAALFVVCSPIFVLYGGQVMTDVPSVLFLTVALIVHLRGIQQQRLALLLIGAALMGLGVNLRETVAFYMPWLVVAPFVLGWKLRRRELAYVSLSVAVFVVLGLGWFGYWFLTGTALPGNLVWMARVPASGINTASGCAAQCGALLDVLFHQRALDVSGATLRSNQ